MKCYYAGKARNQPMARFQLKEAVNLMEEAARPSRGRSRDDPARRWDLHLSDGERLMVVLRALVELTGESFSLAPSRPLFHVYEEATQLAGSLASLDESPLDESRMREANELLIAAAYHRAGEYLLDRHPGTGAPR